VNWANIKNRSAAFGHRQRQPPILVMADTTPGFPMRIVGVPTRLYSIEINSVAVAPVLSVNQITSSIKCLQLPFALATIKSTV
jgi:hypothetical protein